MCILFFSFFSIYRLLQDTEYSSLNQPKSHHGTLPSQLTPAVPKATALKVTIPIYPALNGPAACAWGTGPAASFTEDPG